MIGKSFRFERKVKSFVISNNRRTGEKQRRSKEEAKKGSRRKSPVSGRSGGSRCTRSQDPLFLILISCESSPWPRPRDPPHGHVCFSFLLLLSPLLGISVSIHAQFLQEKQRHSILVNKTNFVALKVMKSESDRNSMERISKTVSKVRAQHAKVRAAC